MAQHDLQQLSRLARQVGIYTSIPMVLLGGPVVGFWVGQCFDRRFGTDPWGMGVAVAIGFLAGWIQTIRLIRYAQQDPMGSSKDPSAHSKPFERGDRVR